MTTYSITSEVIDGSVVYGPYASATDSAWIKVKLNSVIINAATQTAMFNDNVTVLIERTNDDGETYEHYGHIVWYGYTEVYYTRDGVGDYAEFWVGIKEDGWKYRVTITTDATDEIFGEIEFDTSVSRLNPSHGNGGVDIADSYFFRIHGSGGHGTSSALEVSGPIIETRNDNCTFVTIANLAQINFVYPDYVGHCIVSIEGTSTGDHTVAKWGGSSGDAMTRSYTAGNNCYIASYFYTHVNPSSNGSVYFRFVPDDIDAWLSGGGEGEVRDLSPVPVGTFAILALKNTNQSDPVGNTYRSSDIASAPWTADEGTPTQVASGNITTNPGELLLLSAGNVFNPQDAGTFPGRELDWTISGEEILQLRKLWDEAQSDEWDQVIGYQEADSGDNSTAVSASITWDYWPGYYVEFAYFQYLGAISIQETEYCHYVAVPTPEDNNDLPDADQIRAGTDGFDNPALDAQSRGPDADGTVRFDPFSDEDIEPGTDITLCFTWEDESTAVYYELTTAGAVYHVAVETPALEVNRPDAAQIKAGTDGFDDPATDAQVKPLPGSSGTLTFDPFTGAESGTDYTLCYVYYSDDTTYETPEYYELTTLVGDVNVNASTDALILTEYLASISYDIDVNTSVDSLTLTEYNANINAETNVDASLDSLTLTTHSASVLTGTVNILAETSTLTLTTYSADIEATSFRQVKGGKSKSNKKRKKEETPEYLKRIMEPTLEAPKVEVTKKKVNGPSIIPFLRPIPSQPKVIEVVEKTESLKDIIDLLKETQRIQNEKIERLATLLEAKDKEIARLFEELRNDVQDEVVALINAIN